MELSAFERLVRAMADEVPEGYFDGVAEVVVSPRVVSHPERTDVFTLGECVPFGAEAGEAGAVQSRIVLYHGSFVALASITDGFDWDAEAWETLTHELRHHVEWRAQEGGLEAYDAAADANFARHEGDAFDPLFYLDGEAVEHGIFRVDDDVFIDQLVRDMPAEVEFAWQGHRYRIPVPGAVTLPAYLLVRGVYAPPDGDLVVVVRGRARFADLFRARTACELTVDAIAMNDTNR